MAIFKQSLEQEHVLHLLNEFGCIHIEQLYALFENISPNIVRKTILGILEYRKQIEILKERYIVPYGYKSNINQNIISCIWTMIKLSKTPSEVFQSLQAAPPADAYITINNKDAFEIMSVNETSLIKLRSLQEKILSRNASAKKNFIADCHYVIVVQNADLLNKIKTYNYEIPLYVSYLDYSENEDIPNIKIYKKKPQTTPTE